MNRDLPHKCAELNAVVTEVITSILLRNVATILRKSASIFSLMFQIDYMGRPNQAAVCPAPRPGGVNQLPHL
jgi:hypothetical protein